MRNFLVRNRASSPSLEGLLIGMAAVWGVAPAQGVNHGGRHPPTRGRHSADQRRDQHPTSASRRTLWRCLQGGGSVRKTKISIAIWLSGRIRRDGGCWGERSEPECRGTTKADRGGGPGADIPQSLRSWQAAGMSRVDRRELTSWTRLGGRHSVRRIVGFGGARGSLAWARIQLFFCDQLFYRFSA